MVASRTAFDVKRFDPDRRSDHLSVCLIVKAESRKDAVSLWRSQANRAS